MPANHNDIEQKLWDAADELRANSKLKASEYSVQVLGKLTVGGKTQLVAQGEFAAGFI